MQSMFYLRNKKSKVLLQKQSYKLIIGCIIGHKFLDILCPALI